MKGIGVTSVSKGLSRPHYMWHLASRRARRSATHYTHVIYPITQERDVKPQLLPRDRLDCID